jgi:hypothetical protein
VEVVEPVELRAQVRGAAHRILELYRGI